MSLALKPVTMSDIDTFEQVFSNRENASTYQWFGFTNYNSLREAYRERGALGGEENTLSIYDDDELVGRVDWFARTWGRASTSKCWEIAIGVFPACRGRGYGFQGQKLLIDYLFTHYPVHRIQITTDPENKAELACIEKLGFVQEGRIREGQRREGVWQDQLLFSRLRTDWKNPANPYTP